MVKQVPAYEADDGTIFKTEIEAAEHDARCQLKATGIFNEATIIAILTNRENVIDALLPLKAPK